MYAIPLDLSWAAQEAACALASDDAENAHIEDMEYRSELAVLRHYIENRLAAFALAVSTSNPPALTSLLKRVRLHWIDELGMPLPIEADDIIDWLSPSGHHVLLTTSNVSVQPSGPSARATRLPINMGRHRK